MAASREALLEWDGRESPLSSRADRRVHFREKVLLSELHLKDGNRGIILNISEHGLALQSARILDTNSNLQLRFQLSQSPKWIEAEGSATWISASKHAAGVEFIDLSEDALIAIKNWMFTVASLNAEDELEMNVSAATLPQDSATASDVQPPPGETTESLAQLLAEYVIGEGADEGRGKGVESSEHPAEIAIEPGIPEPIIPELGIPEPDFPPKPMVGERTGEAAQWPARIAWALWAAIVVCGFIFGLHLRPVNSQSHEQTTGGQRAEIISSEPPNAVAPVRKPAAPGPSTSPDDFGFVLQVAAMQSESSALAIADVFRAKNLSVFVMKPAARNLYLVLIGPYGDSASAATARAKLKSKGFDAIQRRTSSIQ